MELSIIFIFATIIIVGAILFAFISRGHHGAKKLDVEKFRSKCLAIEQSFKQGEVPSYHLAVLNADKLVGQALSDLGVKGETMGEKMKNAKTTFSDNNGIWNAHKLRNKIAHDTDVYISYDEAKRALANFRKALKDLGAI